MMRGRRVLRVPWGGGRVAYWESGRSYESRKAGKRLQQEAAIFTPDCAQLAEGRLNAEFLVPNFFTSTLALRRFPHLTMPSRASNSFLNSYACLYLPLASEVRLREKLNKLSDGEVRTGRVFEVMDSVAGVVSYEHCFGDITGQAANPMVCVTGSIESFFLFDRVDIRQDLLISGYLSAVGRTSMEIEIHLHQQGKLKVSSIFTMIARNAHNHAQGFPVPALDFSHLSPQEGAKATARETAARENAVRRKAELDNSYDRKPPSQGEISQIHELFLRRREGGWREDSTAIGSTAIGNCEIMHTQERNVHGKIFGGFLIREMVEAGWVAACRHAEDYVLIDDLTNIYFKKPVDVGCRLTLSSKITYVQADRLVITVEAYTAKFTDKRETLACTLQLIAKATRNPRPVHPESYEEALLYLSSKKAYSDLFY